MPAITPPLTFGTKVRLEGLLLLEVLEYFEHAAAISDGVHGGVVGPDEFLRRPEAFVPQRHRRVDDVLPISTHNNKPGHTTVAIYIRV